MPEVESRALEIVKRRLTARALGNDRAIGAHLAERPVRVNAPKNEPLS